MDLFSSKCSFFSLMRSLWDILSYTAVVYSYRLQKGILNVSFQNRNGTHKSGQYKDRFIVANEGTEA